MQEAIAGAVAAGQKPEENWLLILQSSNAKLKNAPGVTDATMELLRYYPRKEHWVTITSALLQRAAGNDTQILQVFRLMDAVDVMDNADEFTEAANVANLTGFPGEALQFLEHGYSTKVLETSGNKAKSQEMLNETRKRASADEKSLPQFEKEAMAAKQGEADVKLGEAYLSYDQPAKAIEAIQRGIGKGGVKNLDDAHLSLGRAYLEAKNVPDAVKAFGEVKNQPDVEIAKLWSIHASSE
jgi:tetratricopeptide (TPR) repeat protein